MPKLTKQHKELLSLLKDSWMRLAVAAICSAIVAAMTAATAYLVKPTVEDIFEQGDPLKLTLIPIVVILVFFVKGLSAYG